VWGKKEDEPFRCGGRKKLNRSGGVGVKTRGEE